ncbi:FAD binding domain-containing protein [Erythrobacter mangrovi]|uniref:FAD binding domain-containing protein n=1 Tax=Erythrobacter mangrovi TaxID=2739433 RepID=A0A7D4CLJ0_9SPHN|nr:FAD binding domain-containing protein [Erythrobacter mangrovi]QKG70648.1 FAD binding domain-containing protein [Erythrobacter mangrovi]
MIPATFSYAAPKSPQEALDLLSAHLGSMILAGGHTLLTALKQRKARAAMLVDIAHVGLDRLEIDDQGNLVIGAAVKQAALAEFCNRNGWALLAEIGAKSGDPMIRARGTFVGALCAAEPGGDWAAGALALDTEIRLLTQDGERMMRLGGYLADPKPGPHLVLEAIIPASMRDRPQGYEKVKHAAIGWSIASVAHVRAEIGLQVAVSGALARPQRLPILEQRDMASFEQAELDAAIANALDQLSFVGDRYAPADWRKRRLGLLLRDVFQSQNTEAPA